MCRTHDSAMQTQSQGLTSRPWDSAAGDMAVLQTSVLFSMICVTERLTGYELYINCYFSRFLASQAKQTRNNI